MKINTMAGHLIPNAVIHRCMKEDENIRLAEQDVPVPKCLVIETVIILFFMAHGIAIPINFFYAEHYLIERLKSEECENISFFDNDLLFSDHLNTTTDIQKEMTTFSMYNKIADGVGIIPALFFGPVIDRVGRKIGLIIPTIGILIKAVLFYAFISLKLNMYFLLLGCAIESLSGGYSVIFVTCLGITADVTPVGPGRTFRIAVIEGLSAIVISAAILITTFWIRTYDYRNPMILSAALSVFLFILIFTVVPETLRTTSPLKCSPKLIIRCIKVFRKSEYFPNRQWKMIVCLLCFVLTVSVNFTKPNLEQLVLRYEPFEWSKIKLSLFVSLSIIFCWIKIIMDSKLLQKIFKLEDLSFAILGCLSSIASLFIFAFVYNDAMAYASVGVGVYIRLIIPMIRSFTSRHVLLKEQGSLFSSLAAVEVFTSSVMGFVFMYIFKETMPISKDSIFIFMAILMIVVLLLFILLKVGTRRDLRSGYEVLSEDNSPFDRERLND